MVPPFGHRPKLGLSFQHTTPFLSTNLLDSQVSSVCPFIISSTGTHVSCFNHLPSVDEIESLGGGSLGMLGAPPNFHCATRLSSLFKADVLLAVTSLLPKETGICKEINSDFPKATVLLKGRDQWPSAVLQGSLRASFHFLSKEFFIRC